MLETNVNYFSEKNKVPVDLKTETRVDDIREEMKDNTIQRIPFQSKALKVHAEKLK